MDKKFWDLWDAVIVASDYSTSGEIRNASRMLAIGFVRGARDAESRRLVAKAAKAADELWRAYREG